MKTVAAGTEAPMRKSPSHQDRSTPCSDSLLGPTSEPSDKTDAVVDGTLETPHEIVFSPAGSTHG